jgi:hypothetical protein
MAALPDVFQRRERVASHAPRKKSETPKVSDLPLSLPHHHTTMPPRPTTPTTEEVWPLQQKPTPVKARIQGAVDFCHVQGIKGRKSAIFR